MNYGVTVRCTLNYLLILIFTKITVLRTFQRLHMLVSCRAA